MISCVYAQNTADMISLDRAPYSAVGYSRYLYINNTPDNSVSVLDLSTNKIKAIVPVESTPSFSLIFGKNLYVHNSGTNTVSVIDVDTSLIKKTLIT